MIDEDGDPFTTFPIAGALMLAILQAKSDNDKRIGIGGGLFLGLIIVAALRQR